MVRRFHRSIYDELDELKASMDYLFQLAFEPMDTPLLLQEEDGGIVCLYQHTLDAEVSEDGDDVIVTVDIIPGSEMTKISVDLVSPDTLDITFEHAEVMRDEDNRYVRQELRSVSLHHEVPLPAPVLVQGARSTLKHGVFDIHLKKARSLQT